MVSDPFASASFASSTTSAAPTTGAVDAFGFPVAAPAAAPATQNTPAQGGSLLDFEF